MEARDGDRPASVNDDAVLWRVSLTFTNTGARTASEIVQVYVVDPRGLPFVSMWKRLVGFGKVEVQAGAAATVSIDVQRDSVAQYSAGRSEPLALTLYPGAYNVSVGPDSEHALLEATVVVRCS